MITKFYKSLDAERIAPYTMTLIIRILYRHPLFRKSFAKLKMLGNPTFDKKCGLLQHLFQPTAF